MSENLTAIKDKIKKLLQIGYSQELVEAWEDSAIRAIARCEDKGDDSTIAEVNQFLWDSTARVSFAQGILDLFDNHDQVELSELKKITLKYLVKEFR